MTAPTVLTIGCSTELQQRCADALAAIGAVLKHGELPQAPTLVAERRPLAIVLPQALYDFDPLEFDALARDVSASLLRVDDDMPTAMLELLLGAAIDAAIARRQKQGAVIVGLDDPRAPPSVRKTAARRRSWMDLEAPPSSTGRV
ncbi:MAG: hypothetical protein QM820_57990 [Minicystis sp.]